MFEPVLANMKILFFDQVKAYEQPANVAHGKMED
jgi:hypothetical protein